MRKVAFVLPLVVAIAAPASAAAADVTSWLALGGGYGFERNGVLGATDRAAAFSATVGVGSSPLNSVVLGGVFRSLTHLSMGTDLSVAARVATGGFARGDWGLAFDAGVAARWWRSGDYGRYPLQFVVTAGAPWGLQIGVGADVWNIAGAPTARGAFAVLELDLLRFTLMRQGATEVWWRNPAPAGGHMTAPR